MTLRQRPTKEGMLAYMEEASKIVASWPKWKREVLREPVDEQEPVPAAETPAATTDLPPGPPVALESCIRVRPQHWAEALQPPQITRSLSV